MRWKDKKRGSFLKTGNTYPYVRTIADPITGEKRELHARTQFELTLLFQLEQKRQLLLVERKKSVGIAQNKQQQADLMNEQLQQQRKEFQSMINQTGVVDASVDWDSSLAKGEFSPFEWKGEAPSQKITYKVGFFKSLFMKEKKFEVPEYVIESLRTYEIRKKDAVVEYLKNKAEFDFEKKKRNEEILRFRKRLEETEREAVEQYISIVITNAKQPGEFEYEFEVMYDREKRSIITDFLFPDLDAFPVSKSYFYHPETDEIEEVREKTKETADLYSKVLYAIAFRTLQEIFAFFYMEGLETVAFNGYIKNAGKNRCAFAMCSTRENLEKIDLAQPLEERISRIEVRTTGDFTKKNEIMPFE